MKISISPLAERKIAELTAGKTGYIKLVFDIDGCGCAVNGVPVLWFVKEIANNDVKVATTGRSIYIDKTEQIFFDDEMTLDFLERVNSFQLKSPGQFLNPRMSLVDQTK